MNRLKVILFDVDGVLLDSLTPHLQICADKNEEYGLGLTIPTASQFKDLVADGTRISPMKYFFLAVGFPEEFAEKANLQYQQIFMQEYAPAPFPHVHSTLNALHEAGLQMGIVTSNVKANVVGALGESMGFFRPDCVYAKDSDGGLSKSEAIVSAVTKFETKPDEVLYVGDQPADWEAAKAAGVEFLGVSYGWGISDRDREFPVVNSVAEISQYVAGRAFAERAMELPASTRR